MNKRLIMKIKNQKNIVSQKCLRAKINGSASLVVLLALGIVSSYVQSQEADSEQLVEEVLVQGMRQSIQTSQELKRNSASVVDSIVAEDIGKLPDRSVTETLQRVPGVTIERFLSIGDPEHFSAEGSGVAVRGLTNVRSELNGRDVFSANGGRTISFEDVPAELMAGVDVYKNQTAEMIEGGLGGTVNLRTRMPFDTDGQQIAFTMSANYGNFVEETHPSFSGLYSNRWDTDVGEIGFLIDIASSKISTRTDGIFTRPYFERTNLALQDHQGNSIVNEGESVWVSRGADWRSMYFDRDRLGAYTALQWRPTETIETYLQVFQSKYEMGWNEDAIFVSNNPWETSPIDGYDIVDGEVVIDPDVPSPVFDSNGVFVSGRVVDTGSTGGVPFGSDMRAATRESKTTDYSAGVKWLPSEKWEILFDLQHTKSTTEGVDLTLATGINVPYMDLDLRGKLPKIGTDEEYLSDYKNYYWNFTMPHIDDSEAKSTALKGDAEYDIDVGALKSIKFGARFTDVEATNIDTSYYWRAVFAPWMFWWALEPDLGIPRIKDTSQIHLNQFDNFFRGDAELTGAIWAPNLDLATNYPDSFSDLYAGAAAQAEAEGHNAGTGSCGWCNYNATGNVPYPVRSTEDPEWKTTQKETTSAIYVMAKYAFDDLSMPVDGNLGVRVVRTEGSSEGNAVLPGEVNNPDNLKTIYFGAGYSPLYAERSDTHVLPSFNLRWQVAEDVYLRFAVSKAIARPSFNQLMVYRALSANPLDEVPDGVDPTREQYNLKGDSLFSNPYLKPMRANQFDFSAEWYFAEGGSLHLNAFRKDIDDFIRTRQATETWGTGDQAADYLVSIPDNVGSAKISGFEIGYSQFYDFLPKPFDGLGTQINYTYINSSTDVQNEVDPLDTNGVRVSESLPVEGISDNAFNFVAMYEKGGLSMRLAWSWRSEYLTSVGPNGFNGSDGGTNGNNGVNWKLPVYADDYGQWDGQISYDITESINLGLQINNITNETTKLLAEQNVTGKKSSSYFVNDTRYALNLAFKF